MQVRALMDKDPTLSWEQALPVIIGRASAVALPLPELVRLSVRPNDRH